ncbi:hypothetical protein ACFQ0Q_40795 [Streptomyces aureus]
MSGITAQSLTSPADFAPPAPLLPLLTLGEAQDVVELLATVAVGGVAGSRWAHTLAMNRAARVPSQQ